ncbi:MAG: serine/threonine-protein phosphatase [Butyrivibrio sp.]|nr:serine/threonine-protein phosphatase [Butyrivibrio sp.]
MEVKACIFTDAGKKRRINQDAAMIKVANTLRHGRISFIAVCDGMGGLSKGEVASCKAVRALEGWFCEEFALMQDLEEDKLWDTVETSLRRLIVKTAAEIKRYARHRGINMGTTLTALLQIGKRYITVNVGDSRIYCVGREKAECLTRDQSVVADKVRRGEISESLAESDPQKNVLLQCVGSSREVEPDVTRGEFDGDTTVVACSDGLWRTLEKELLHKRLCPQMCITPEDMLIQSKKLAQEAFDKHEEDNISIAAMCLQYS